MEVAEDPQALFFLKFIYFQNSFMTILEQPDWCAGSDPAGSLVPGGLGGGRVHVALHVILPGSIAELCMWMSVHSIWTTFNSVQRRFGYIQAVIPLSQRNSLCFHHCSLFLQLWLCIQCREADGFVLFWSIKEIHVIVRQRFFLCKPDIESSALSTTHKKRLFSSCS